MACMDPYWDAYYSQMDNSEIDPYDGWLAKYSESISTCEKVLDLGCGAGTNIDALLELCKYNVYAADISLPALKLIDIKYNQISSQVHICNFDMRDDFPYESELFDAVVADLSIHYFSDIDTKHIIHEIERILRPNGIFLARVHSTKNLKNSMDTTKQDRTSCFVMSEGYQRRYFTIESLKSLFGNWDIIDINEHSIYRYQKEKEIIELMAVLR